MIMRRDTGVNEKSETSKESIDELLQWDENLEEMDQEELDAWLAWHESLNEEKSKPKN